MYRPKVGTFDDPIEIIDSDDESRKLCSSDVIDLTQDDMPILGRLSAQAISSAANKDSSKTSNASSHFSSRELSRPLGLPQLGLPERRDKSSTIQNGVKLSSPAVSSQFHLPVGGDNLIAAEAQFISDEDTDSEILEVMDGSTWHSLQRGRENTSETPEDAQSRRQTRSSTRARDLSTDPADLQDRKNIEEPPSEIYTPQCPLLSAVLDVLWSVKAEMMSEHAAYVNTELKAALKKSQELQKTMPSFVDAVDPFAHMPPLVDQHTSTQRQDQFDTVDKATNESSAEASIKVDRLPPYKHYTTIRRSFLVPDRTKLYFEPYLGHGADNNEISSRKWLDRLKKIYEPSEDPQASRRREKASKLNEYIPRILARLELQREDIVSHMIETGLVALGPPESTLERFLVAFKEVFEIDIEHVFPEYGEHLKALKKSGRKLDKGKDTKKSDPVKDLLSPHLLSCPVCHVYLCGIHGVYEYDSSEDEGTEKEEKASRDYADMNLTYEGILLRHEAKSTTSKSTTDKLFDGKPCSEQCFKTVAFDEEETSQWTSDDTTYLQTLLLGMENEPRASCILAPLSGKPCYDIRRFIILNTSKVPKQVPDESRKAEKLDWYDNKRKKIRVDLDWGKKTTTHLHHKIGQPIGCEHSGKSCFDAGSECSCNEEGVLCDKFCSCLDDCYMKFTGCNCSKGNFPCSQESEKCPCKLLNRECDPDLCHDCGARETVDPFNPSRGSSREICCNTDIQMGNCKRLLAGESSHPGNIGFGAYTAEPVRQGEFIAEYVGEIISNAECGRRSEVYDKLNTSFIFDLNDEVAIDSYRYGNLTRFINHSVKNANCKPLVRLVVGDHRIGFFATKDLGAGVELFFNYGKNFTSKQELKEMDTASTERKGVASKKVGESSNSVKNGAKDMGDMEKDTRKASMVEDHENLDDKIFRQGWAYSFPDDEREDEDMDERDEGNVGRTSRRPKRNIPQPKRYTQ